MTKIWDETTRRGALQALGAGAVVAAASMGGLGVALAAAPPLGKQAGGAYRYKIGDIEATQVTDGARTFPLADNFVRNAPREQINAALTAAYMPADKMTIVFNPMVLNTGGKLVVIDTGNGPDPKGEVGQFVANMTASDIDPKTVDMVVISHFHGDHINGIRAADGGLAFANAEIKVPAAEWAFWMSDENMAKAPEAMKGAFANVRRVFKDLGDRVSPYQMDKELVSGVTPFATWGHTPGHTSYAVQSGNQKLLIQSDITNHPALFVRNPGWHAIFDQDPVMAEETRRKFFDRASADKVMIAGFHYPFPSVGHVEKDGTGYRLVPMAWNPSL